MAAILITGMSGVGKSTALNELARRGHRVVDTDDGGWSEQVSAADGSEQEQLWREDRMQALLAEHTADPLFVSGCVANQGAFYRHFTAVVLLSVPEQVLLQRLRSGDTNDFGKTAAERDRILRDLRTVEPLLRAGASEELDARAPVGEVADRIEAIAAR
jgi:shikimate kinase